MKVNWKNNEAEHTVTSPMTLNISSFSNVQDLHKSVTPELSNSDSTLLHLWAHSDKYRLGAAPFIKVLNFMVEQHQILMT